MYLLKLLEVAKKALFTLRIIITSQDFSSNTFNIQRRVTLMHLLVDDWLDMQVVVQWNLSLTTTPLIKFIACDLFNIVF